MSSHPQPPATPSPTGQSSRPTEIVEQYQVTSGDHASRSCPECGTDISVTGADEVVCTDCHLVIRTEFLSTSPRPQYDEADQSKARSGSRVTLLYADRGLGVGVETGARTDARGNALSRTGRRVASDQGWTKALSTAEYRLDYALSEIRRMGGILNVPTAEQEAAAGLYRQAHSGGHVVGRSVDGFTAAALLIAVRQSSVPLPVSGAEIEDVMRADTDQFRTARGVFEVELNVGVPPMSPLEFVPKAASDVAAPQQVRRRAQSLLEAYMADESSRRNLSPRTLAAAALHAAFDRLECTERPTLSELSSAVGVAASTISERKSLLIKYQE